MTFHFSVATHDSQAANTTTGNTYQNPWVACKARVVHGPGAWHHATSPPLSGPVGPPIARQPQVKNISYLYVKDTGHIFR